MSDAGNEKLRLEIELMTVQIDKGRVDIERMRADVEKMRAEGEKMRAEGDKFRAEMRHMQRWEPIKALAAILASSAALLAAAFGLAHLIR